MNKSEKYIDFYFKQSIIFEYLEKMKHSISENSYTAYKEAVKSFFFKFLNLRLPTDEDIMEVTTTQGNEWLYQMKKDGYANKSINQKLGALQWFYKNLKTRDFGVVTYNPFTTDEGSQRLKGIAMSTGMRIPDDKLQALNAFFSSRRDWTGERNYILFLLFATTGMRRSEVCSIKLGQFTEYGNKFILTFIGKGGKFNMAEIPYALKGLIDSFLTRSGWDYTMREHPLFTREPSTDEQLVERGVLDIFKRAYKKVGLPDTTTIHDLRHTYISKSIEQGLNIYDIAKRVGHSSVNTTQRYDHTNRIFQDNPAEDFYSQLTAKAQEQYPYLKVLQRS